MISIECKLFQSFANPCQLLPITVIGKGSHSKSWIESSADDFEFSTKGLSGNAKTIKFELLVDLTLQFVLNYANCLNLRSIKTSKLCIFSLKMPFRHKLVVKIHALFPWAEGHNPQIILFLECMKFKVQKSQSRLG